MTAPAAASAADTYRDLSRERRWLADCDASVLQSQVDIARIPAPTGLEATRARYIASELAAAGLRAVIDDAGNVVARAAGAYEAAPVVVCAHLDTVFPTETDHQVRRDGQRLIGPGICDNGRGLAVMLVLARVMSACRSVFARPIEFVATTGEEGAGNLRGARHYLASARRPAALVAIDGAGDGRVINTGLGSRRFRVTYRGPGGHSWAAYGTANPVHAAARAAAALAGLRIPAATRSALSVSRIGGGISINAIPEEAWLEVDVRSTSDAALTRLECEVRDVAAAAATEENGRRAAGTDGLRFEVIRIGDRPGGATPDDVPLVAAAVAATRLVGREPELATASTDANAAMSLGVPAIAIGGGGRGGAAHTHREWFENSGATAGVERALTIVATMARMAAD